MSDELDIALNRARLEYNHAYDIYHEFSGCNDPDCQSYDSVEGRKKRSESHALWRAKFRFNEYFERNYKNTYRVSDSKRDFIDGILLNDNHFMDWNGNFFNQDTNIRIIDHRISYSDLSSAKLKGWIGSAVFDDLNSKDSCILKTISCFRYHFNNVGKVDSIDETISVIDSSVRSGRISGPSGSMCFTPISIIVVKARTKGKYIKSLAMRVFRRFADGSADSLLIGQIVSSLACQRNVEQTN